MNTQKKACVISSYTYITENVNYGALLQYYALEKTLSKLGIEAYWLRFRSPGDRTLKRKIKKIIKLIIRPLDELKIRKTLLSFDRFIEQYANVSKEEYLSEEMLFNNPPEADVYITGSDQVWAGTLEPNYLTFASDNKPKVSYAASFGKNEISDEHKTIIKPWLAKMDAVSVRESSGVDICQSIGIDSVQVLDPTLLIGENEYPARCDCYCPDVYCYFLNFKYLNEISWDRILKFVLDEKLSIKIACTNQTFQKYSKEYRDLPSPEEWLTKYRNAKYIITNTFHGTVFAIIFRKQFIVIKQKGEGAKQNIRISSLLEKLGLEYRYYDENSPLSQQINSSINWDLVEKKITSLRHESFEYLNRVKNLIEKRSEVENED